MNLRLPTVAVLRRSLCDLQVNTALTYTGSGVSASAETRESDNCHLPQAPQHTSIAFESPLYRSEQPGHVPRPKQNAVTQMSQRPVNVKVFGEQVMIVEAEVRKYGSGQIVSTIASRPGGTIVLD